MVTICMRRLLKQWLARAENNQEARFVTQVEWKKIPDVAQYKGADWKNEVLRKTHLTLEQAKSIAASNPEIAFFFFMKKGVMHLEGRGGPSGWESKGSFVAGDAVFF